MPTDLERIEARHRLMMVEGGAYCEICRGPDGGLPNYRLIPYPCDVLKLARALDEVRPLLKLAAFGEATDLMLEMGAASIERTLHEVAGGDDAE